MKKAVLFSLAIIATSSFSVEAATYNLGQLGATPVVQFVQVLPGAVSDRFDFSLGSLSDAAASATNHALYFGQFSVLDIPNLSMSIFDANNNIIGGAATSGTSVTNASMAAGSYYALISGNTSGSFGGAYSIAMSAATVVQPGPSSQPVPVPPALWLLASGVVGVAGVARRRKAA